MIETKFVERIAQEASVRPEQVTAAIALFDKGSTVPFVARYRKDVTGNLNEVALEQIHDRNVYFTALSNRRNAIIENIAKQNALTDELRAQIESCYSQTDLEDLYLPFKKQRRTKASMAREQGLEPLAEFIWAQVPADKTIDAFAATFVTPVKSISSPEEALDGARNILAERISVDPWARVGLRRRMQEEGTLTSLATKAAEQEKTKFEQYYNFSEPLKTVPSHRLLAVLRGARLGILKMDIVIDDEAAQAELANHYVKAPGTEFEAHIRAAALDAYKRLLRPGIENEVVTNARAAADQDAIKVFRENARNLLLSPPAGRLAVLGVDPGLRTGCKLAAIDQHGRFLESATIFPSEPHNDQDGAAKTIVDLIERNSLNAVAIGNGTGSREVEKFIRETLHKHEKKEVLVALVSESGASIYSASKTARDEFPDIDVTIRGAISIARRLQDPLAELVKLDPKTLGVGQYQHDVNQRDLRENLYRTVESCVNSVGVDVNTASVDLLRYVSGIQMGTAQNIIEHRTKIGGFLSREQLKEVSGIGEKTFEQCAGFLRIPTAENPLDRTAIHPESYPIVEKIAEQLGQPVTTLIAQPEKLSSLQLDAFSTENIGMLTLEDIREELKKPGRDPRSEFRVPRYIDGVYDVESLQEGMEAEGVVTNVTDFGAFVDIGVHQDGLVHLSELARQFVKDPRDFVKAGEVVRVKVIKIDRDTKRISLSMKQLLPAPERAPRPEGDRPRRPRPEGGAPAAAGEAPQGEQRPRREGQGGEGGQRPQRSENRGPRREGGEGGQRPQRGEGRGPRREGGEGGGQRPPRSDSRPPRPEGDAPRRRDDRGPRRAPAQADRHGTPSALKHADNTKGSFNSTLADKLAALKEKLDN